MMTTLSVLRLGTTWVQYGYTTYCQSPCSSEAKEFLQFKGAGISSMSPISPFQFAHPKTAPIVALVKTRTSTQQRPLWDPGVGNRAMGPQTVHTYIYIYILLIGEGLELCGTHGIRICMLRAGMRWESTAPWSLIVSAAACKQQAFRCVLWPLCEKRCATIPLAFQQGNYY